MLGVFFTRGRGERGRRLGACSEYSAELNNKMLSF